MRKNSLPRRGIALVVIVLFIGLAFAPSINARSPIEKHIFTLAEKQICEVDCIFEHLHEQLQKVDSRDETSQLFRDTAYKLWKKGLIDELSYKMALLIFSDVFQIVYNKQILSSNNSNCLIAGNTSQTRFYRTLFEEPHEIKWRPFKLNLDITLGYYEKVMDDHGTWIFERPSKGWFIAGLGPKGIKMNGSFRGRIGKIDFYPWGVSDYHLIRYYIGVKSFTGISLYSNGRARYFGYAPFASVDYWNP